MKDDNKTMETLKSLVGMEKVTAQFEQYLAEMQMCRQRDKHFLPHMAFLGNPGTGKTIVAHLFSKILYEYGLLSKDQFVLVTPCDLIGEYVGNTFSKTQAVCEQAKGGILFIDEAYGLDCDFGNEALAMLIGFMTEVNNDTIVIFAGYPDEMKKFLKGTNPGLIRRISHIFNFEDFTNNMLVEIFRQKLINSNYVIDEDGLAQAKTYFASLKRGKCFGNARESERLFFRVKANQARRLATMTNPSTDDVLTILPQDIPVKNAE